MSTDQSPNQPPGPDAAPDQYVVVARRYRPQNFEDLVGQQQVSKALAGAITTNRVGHAYLFTGARGVGKTSSARIFAKALNCVDGPTPKPCGKCDICTSIATGEDVDVLEIDGASNRGIDEIRQLRSNVNVRPSRSRYKIYIIDEVHMLTTPAFNALLKTLEEPPEHVKFFFCTTDPEKIPITVLSRCQKFDFAPVEANSIVERLQFIVDEEQLTAEPEALQMLARRAGGSMRDSQSLLEQLFSSCESNITVDDVHRMLGTARGGRLADLTDKLIARDGAAALSEIDKAIAEGVDAGQFAEQILGYFRDMMAAAVGCDAELFIHTAPGDIGRLRDHAQSLGVQTILAVLQILDATLTKARQSGHVRTLLEMSIVRICNLQDLQQLSDAVAQVSSGGTAKVSLANPQKPPTPPPSAPASSPPAVAETAEKKNG